MHTVDDEYMMMLHNVAKNTHHRQHISEETEGETTTTMKTLRLLTCVCTDCYCADKAVCGMGAGVSMPITSVRSYLLGPLLGQPIILSTKYIILCVWNSSSSTSS